ncbi:NnrU family protein [Pelomonas sp. CA6]|uniref:NnrU family protein n=1 Tax=Pelomonas sp. CA6 TaxID=2907999 RepID=UPI001F4C492B|nr:NnrU family protein [Pelomonas sp. CA6]MCH7345932.1 NnrU family protein [Pelomonas sp. CA6]
MLWLTLGLILFLGVHATRIVAEDWRSRQLARLGEKRWKGLYSLVSALGLGLMVWGYGQARLTPLPLWAVPKGMNHLAGLLMLGSLVLLAAAYVPRNHLKSRLAHPMLLAVKVWALAHLLANNTAADLLLFGSFLLWAVLDFRSARRRPAATAPATSTLAGTLATGAIGVTAWAAFVLGLHQWLIGVRPFG